MDKLLVQRYALHLVCASTLQVLLLSIDLLVQYTDILLLANVIFSDRCNNRVRKITASTGIITTIAGTGDASYNGDDIDATSATLNVQNGIALDSSGKCTSKRGEYYKHLLVLL